MPAFGFTGVEHGSNVSLEFDGGQVIKTSHRAMTKDRALFAGELLWQYAGNLGFIKLKRNSPYN